MNEAPPGLPELREPVPTSDMELYLTNNYSNPGYCSVPEPMFPGQPDGRSGRGLGNPSSIPSWAKFVYVKSPPVVLVSCYDKILKYDFIRTMADGCYSNLLPEKIYTVIN